MKNSKKNGLVKNLSQEKFIIFHSIQKIKIKTKCISKITLIKELRLPNLLSLLMEIVFNLFQTFMKKFSGRMIKKIF
jgi:hypothetical protein